MENPKNQLASKLKDANNVLVTVSTNPSVDQLSAAIGLTLYLTKMKKHATTVFSGQVPSTIDFLKPEETIETNTDSLRDFIISLDKNKADKIRYKVEDTMVKIFITPYRTSIGDQDLVFSQGDFNVDVVIALGIHNKEDLDQAITAHGRILHDATVATVNTKDGSDIGTLNWVDQQASSLCEMAVTLTDLIKTSSLDGQMATAFLTGIVAETERFSNEKTSSVTMNASAKLMAAGANQQLVATKLEPPEEPQAPPEAPKGPDDSGESLKDISIDDDGALRIDHESTIPETGDATPAPPPSDTLPSPVMPEAEEPAPPPVSQVKIDEDGELQLEEPKIKQDHRGFLGHPPVGDKDQDMFGLPGGSAAGSEDRPAGTSLVTEPPKFGGQLSAAADDSIDTTSPLNLPPVNTPILNHDSGAAKKDEKKSDDSDDDKQGPASPPPPLPPEEPPAPSRQTGHPFVDMDGKTLNEIEKKIDDERPKPKSDQDEDLDYHKIAAEKVAEVVSDKKLNDIEEQVDSPHMQAYRSVGKAEPQEEADYHKAAAEQVAKAVSDKTLVEIEEKVGSPHVAGQPDEPGVLPPAGSPKDEGPKLDYEPHESEPPETATSDDNPVDDVAGDDQAAADDNHATADDTASDDQSVDDSKPDDKPAETKDEKAEEARDAVMQAIGTGGDGRTSLPPLESLGASVAMPVSHDGASSQPPPDPQEPSPNIEIDDKGNLKFAQSLEPDAGLPEDATAAPSNDAGAPPPVPPPLMPPMPEPSENGQ